MCGSSGGSQTDKLWMMQFSRATWSVRTEFRFGSDSGCLAKKVFFLWLFPGRTEFRFLAKGSVTNGAQSGDFDGDRARAIWLIRAPTRCAQRISRNVARHTRSVARQRLRSALAQIGRRARTLLRNDQHAGDGRRKQGNRTVAKRQKWIHVLFGLCLG